ncbi:Cytochrome b2, mitochondrial [Lachnellula willkommii]|uniref:Cytochrome b2, mitochondrial n=1 Tax=Lachnellula willkommii TaxID=215461 RepID=A0A559MFF7_9HELO|nr:Cytochrome b2, mitochondrial [Lachnellula willkommii]
MTAKRDIPSSPEISSSSSAAANDKPRLETILNANDFTKAAERAFTPRTSAFYSSAATDLVTNSKNRELVRRIMNVDRVDISRKILGSKSAAPFFISPTALVGLAHPDGELALRRAAANENIFQCISMSASFPFNSIVGAVPAKYPFFLQLYFDKDRLKTKTLLNQARDLGVKAIFRTVDSPTVGKREADERAAQNDLVGRAQLDASDKKAGGFGKSMGRFIDKTVMWEDIATIRRESRAKVVLKGVQTAEDVKMAVDWGVDAVLLSNRGGRSLDGSQATILVLLEVRKNYPEAFDKIEIFIDGGFERGSDILKAICLGATAVGIGRPFLYSLSYGQEGAERLSQILKDELETSMTLLGITSLDMATPPLVNKLDLDHLVISSGRDVERRSTSKL